MDQIINPNNIYISIIEFQLQNINQCNSNQFVIFRNIQNDNNFRLFFIKFNLL